MPVIGGGRRIGVRAAVQTGRGDPMTEDDVGHEAEAVREREGEAERRAGEPDVGQDEHPAHRQHKGKDVAAGVRADRGEDHGAEELDRADRRQRQPGDGEVEQRVHRGQHDAQRGEHRPLPTARTTQDAPGPAPAHEDHGGRGDAQPRHAENGHPRAEQHRQRRAEVVEHHAGEEERRRGQRGDGGGDAAGPGRDLLRGAHPAYPAKRSPAQPWPTDG
jgi:hypothetical protein